MSASACAEVAVDLIMAGSTESTKGLIFVNQSDTQPQRGGFRHSNKKSQQHRMQTEPSQQPHFTAINNYNCSSLFASVYSHRSVDTIMSETRGLWCYFASANLLWACNNFITPFYTWHKMSHFQKRVCKVISFSNSKLESLPLSPSPRPQTFFALLFLLFSFLSLLLPFLLSYHLLSLFSSFVPSFLASLQSFAFPCCFLYSVPSVLSSFLLPFSPSLPSSCLPFFRPWPLPFFSPIFTLFMPPFLIAHHLCPHPCFFPSIFPSILPTSSYFFLPSFLLYVFLVDESLQVLCVLNDEVAAFNSAAVRGSRVPPSPPHTSALSL